VRKKTDPLVLDAFPVLDFFLKKPGWERVGEILDDAVRLDIRHLLSAINFGEIRYTILRDAGPEQAAIAVERIKEGPIDIVLPTLKQVIQASTFKAGGGISYADCFAGALALERDLPVLTGDEEFKRLIQYGVKVEWLPRIG
jgi:predicted nucleic acid-binding protein